MLHPWIQPNLTHKKLVMRTALVKSDIVESGKDVTKNRPTEIDL